MATLYGTNATKQLNQTITQLVEQGENKGVLRVHFDKFTLAADLGATDIVKMGGLLPANARVLRVEMEAGALGGSCAFTYGHAASAQLDSAGVAVESADDDAFAQSFAAATALAKDSGALVVGSNAAKWKRFSASVQPQIAMSAASSGATGLSIYASIYYVIE